MSWGWSSFGISNSNANSFTLMLGQSIYVNYLSVCVTPTVANYNIFVYLQKTSSSLLIYSISITGASPGSIYSYQIFNEQTPFFGGTDHGPVDITVNTSSVMTSLNIGGCVTPMPMYKSLIAPAIGEGLNISGNDYSITQKVHLLRAVNTTGASIFMGDSVIFNGFIINPISNIIGAYGALDLISSVTNPIFINKEDILTAPAISGVQWVAVLGDMR